MPSEKFPIDLGALKPLKLDPKATELTGEQKEALTHNIQLCRDAIVFFTALAGAKGLSGHTGGAFDTVPDLLDTDELTPAAATWGLQLALSYLDHLRALGEAEPVPGSDPVAWRLAG